MPIVIGVRLDGFLVKYKEGSFKDKILNFVKGSEHRAEIDQTVLNFLEYVFRNTEYTIDLIIPEDRYTPALQELLAPLPFNRVVLIHNPADITYRLNIGDLTYYVDDSQARRSEVSSKFSYSLSEIYSELRRRQ